MIPRPATLWLLFVPIAMAVGYGLYEVARLNAQIGQLTSSDVLWRLASERRIQTFVVLPSWLIACCAVISRSYAPGNLIRSGSWKTATNRSWRRLFVVFFVSTALVVTGWLGIAAVGARPDGNLLLALGMCGVSVIWVAASLGSVFSILSIVALLTSSRAATAAIALAIWIWAGLSNLDLFIGTDFDAGYYFSFGAALTRPSTIVISLAAFMVLSTGAWLVANERDQAHRNGTSKMDYGVVAGLLAFALVFLEAGSDDSGRLSSTSVFAGLDGSIAQYLYGMLPLLLIVSIGTSRFSEDWHLRLSSLAIRYGSYSRLVWRHLTRQLLTLFLYVGGLLCVALVARLSTRASTMSWPAEIAGGLSTFPRLFLACLLLMAIGTLAVVVLSSEITWAAASGLLLALGFLPFNASPMFPITGWATTWTGANANIAGLFLTLTATAVITATMIFARTTKGVTSHARY